MARNFDETPKGDNRKMQWMIFWPTLAEFGLSPSAPDILAALLATYGIIKLLEFEKYGPYDVLKLYEKGFTKMFGEYCDICMSFWVMISVMYLMPDILAYGASGIGAYVAIEMIGDK